MKLFVGNLPYDMTEEDLQTTFEKAGEVQSAKIIFDKYTSRSKGFGFVEMSSREEAATAISELNGKEVNGRPLAVKEAIEKERRPSHGRV